MFHNPTTFVIHPQLLCGKRFNVFGKYPKH